MRVHLVKKRTIEDFVNVYPGSSAPFIEWLYRIKRANWETPSDILKAFNSADLLGNGTDRVVFNIGGNNYRMICRYLFGISEVGLFICWIGSHSAYSRLCNENKQYYIRKY
ncbi:type II toxin-antitoxin system HigB family toxin [Chitinophaga sp. SYP-B3965]|uniref:type II toxin-antitoxin system HigB family toxin n=1 Tax=Chitinophaga sp. SYP-B3965 TaxID=2663120 RepID=UPI0012998375|nr:type II toxin-antitoxin system HigB family toxin [Chitinophaga sp. SYP-B3965]MRG43992.1 type II toxin-antitoxin system HigB family toxin [Chitinophaga sp. SYP-B3965]